MSQTTANFQLEVDADGSGWLTSSGWVVSGHLSEVCVVLYYSRSTVSPLRLARLPRPSDSITRVDMGVERTLRTEELSRDVQGLTSHNDNLLSVEQLLGHSAGQPTKEVALAIDCDLYQ